MRARSDADSLPPDSLAGENKNKTMKMSTENESLFLPQQSNGANIKNNFTPGKSNDKENTKEAVSEARETPEVTSNMEGDIKVDFDPFTIVENIADLTVEHLKETLLGPSEQETQNEDPPSRSVDIESESHQVDMEETKIIFDKLQKLKSDMKSIESVESAPLDSKSKSASSSPGKKKCRLRVVNKDEGSESIKSAGPSAQSSKLNSSFNKDQDTSNKIGVMTPHTPLRSKRKERKDEKENVAEIHDTKITNRKDKTEVLNVTKVATKQNNRKSSLSVEAEKTKISNDSSSSTDIVVSKETVPSRGKRRETKPGDQSNELRISGARNVTLEACGTVQNDYDAKKVEAVNIPTIRTFESVQIPSQNETKNGQMCRQSQGIIFKII